MTKPSLLLCVPGPWRNLEAFAEQVAESTNTEFVVEDGLLTRPIANQQVRLAFAEHDPGLRVSFEAASQGNLSPETRTALEVHASVAVLAFEDVLIEEREKIGDFSNLMRQLGGIAVKVESAALAHEWDAWLQRITSENPVDWYLGVVSLFRDEDEQCYCSCGMHHFGLLDVQAPASMGLEPATDLINQFNIFQIGRRTVLKDGQTFSLSAQSPNFRMKAVRDHRHAPDDLLHNPHGIWKFGAAK